ncbi:unnamed protein product [Mytilus edulis]|uniref:Uncharacterized protein n=1 Tax=Mytilus edulis TaxID=6550 RepID=A0A8S3RF04_MYTED|nr:unnamed protein product [Mytilus edulis]
MKNLVKLRTQRKLEKLLAILLKLSQDYSDIHWKDVPDPSKFVEKYAVKKPYPGVVEDTRESNIFVQCSTSSFTLNAEKEKNLAHSGILIVQTNMKLCWWTKKERSSTLYGNTLLNGILALVFKDEEQTSSGRLVLKRKKDSLNKPVLNPVKTASIKECLILSPSCRAPSKGSEEESSGYGDSQPGVGIQPFDLPYWIKPPTGEGTGGKCLPRKDLLMWSPKYCWRY